MIQQEHHGAERWKEPQGAPRLRIRTETHPGDRSPADAGVLDNAAHDGRGGRQQPRTLREELEDKEELQLLEEELREEEELKLLEGEELEKGAAGQKLREEELLEEELVEGEELEEKLLFQVVNMKFLAQKRQKSLKSLYKILFKSKFSFDSILKHTHTRKKKNRNVYICQINRNVRSCQWLQCWRIRFWFLLQLQSLTGCCIFIHRGGGGGGTPSCGLMFTCRFRPITSLRSSSPTGGRS